MTKKRKLRDNKGQFKKGHKGGPGRSKKAVGTGRPFEDMVAVFGLIGGIETMTKWAKQNNTNMGMFYSLLMRTVPKEVVEKLLLPKHQESTHLTIEYVPVRCQQRVDQLERFIAENGLNVPARPKVRVPLSSDDSAGPGGGGNDHGQKG